MSKAFGKRLELLLTVVNELVEGAALVPCEFSQGNKALLVRQ